MRRIRQICKALFVSLAIAMLISAPMGCGGSDEKKLPDKPDISQPDHPDHPE